ncbi:MAG: hypothetical protein SFW62_09040 [Alphaproteobacteria bacterium]|nr:hypothetical protein [Alphaproteobacteria bacterium]
MILSWLERYLLVHRNTGPHYICLFEKRIQVPQNDGEKNIALLFSGGIVKLNRRIDLPFPPQIGMSVSDFIEFPSQAKNTESVDGVNFISGPIESVHWNNTWKRFECNVAPTQLSDKSELGSAIIKHMLDGWKSPPSDSVGARAIGEFLTQCRAEIENKEKETGNQLEVDREWVEKVQKIYRNAI